VELALTLGGLAGFALAAGGAGTWLARRTQ
jgi:hypothetical protein